MHIPNFSEIEQSAAELFQGSNEPFLRDEWTELYTKLGEVIYAHHMQSPKFQISQMLLRFSFRNQSASKATGVKHGGQISDFLTVYKIWEGRAKYRVNFYCQT